MSEKGQLAKKYFEEGYNCSQAVAMAFSDNIGFDKASLAKMTVGFGGGMGRMREVCGAFSGIALVISLKYGSDLPNNDNKKEVYKIIQELAQQFKNQNGSIVCRELLGLSKNENGGTPEKRTPEYYKKRPCADIVAEAANILDDYFKNHNN